MDTVLSDGFWSSKTFGLEGPIVNDPEGIRTIP